MSKQEATGYVTRDPNDLHELNLTVDEWNSEDINRPQRLEDHEVSWKRPSARTGIVASSYLGVDTQWLAPTANP